MRAFVGVILPKDILDDLDRFLEPRREIAGPWRWSPRENWHITLAFIEQVGNLERLIDQLSDVAPHLATPRLRCDGAGAFPRIDKANHLYQRVDDTSSSLTTAAIRVRNACQISGSNPDGKKFVPHLTVARTNTGFDATKWWRVLDTWQSRWWSAEEFLLIESHLGQGIRGSARYEIVQRFAIGMP